MLMQIAKHLATSYAVPCTEKAESISLHLAQHSKVNVKAHLLSFLGFGVFMLYSLLGLQ